MTEERPMGLRERKKAATREALGWAALQLAAERGLDNVRVDDIAERVGVSPRTFNNYFPSKEAAIGEIAVARATRIGEALRERPSHERLGVAIEAAVVGQYLVAGEPDRAQVARMRRVAQQPALRAEFHKRFALGERSLAEAIGERTGLDPDRDLMPEVLASAVLGAARVATEHWFRSSDQPMEPFLRAAVAQVIPEEWK